MIYPPSQFLGAETDSVFSGMNSRGRLWFGLVFTPSFAYGATIPGSGPRGQERRARRFKGANEPFLRCVDQSQKTQFAEGRWTAGGSGAEGLPTAGG